MIDSKKIAQALLNTIGGEPRVIEYVDNNNVSKIDIYVGKDRPLEGVTTYSTIGLSVHTIGFKSDKQIRVELIGACYNSTDKFANIISSCAFNIINSNFSCKPGTVYPNVITEYYPDAINRHILFLAPFLWDSVLKLVFSETIVTWLMAIPISDNELSFIKREGDESLVTLFTKNSINVFDINRKSII